jgi:hypothetical protein
MRPKYVDRLLGRSHLLGATHSWMGMSEVSDDPGQQMFAGERRRHHYHRTRAALAELGGAEACLHQEGLGRSTWLATRSPARVSAPAAPAPLARLLMRPPTRRCVWGSLAGRGVPRTTFAEQTLQTRAIVHPVSLPQVIRGCRSCIFFFGLAVGMALRKPSPMFCGFVANAG